MVTSIITIHSFHWLPAENIRLRISKREFQRMAVSMPFVPEDTAKECNKKRRVEKKRERRLSAREMPREKKILAIIRQRGQDETPPLSKVSLLIFYVSLSFFVTPMEITRRSVF